jgi:hypothetical protein
MVNRRWSSEAGHALHLALRRQHAQRDLVGAQRHHDEGQALALLRAEGAGAVDELGAVLHIGHHHRQPDS